jgi:hypothetical protein
MRCSVRPCRNLLVRRQRVAFCAAVTRQAEAVPSAADSRAVTPRRKARELFRIRGLAAVRHNDRVIPAKSSIASVPAVIPADVDGLGCPLAEIDGKTDSRFSTDWYWRVRRDATQGARSHSQESRHSRRRIVSSCRAPKSQIVTSSAGSTDDSVLGVVREEHSDVAIG